jgi:hypothetical protein
MKIGLWSTTASSNNASPPDGAPEGWLPSTVNDVVRENMAQIRTYCQNAQWFDHGMSPTFINATTFTVPGDQSAYLEAGRALKLYDATTRYDKIATASASAVSTTVIISGNTSVTAALSSFALGIISKTNNALPTGADFSAGTRMVFAQAAAPTGWTQDTTDNADNRMLRVVKTAGNGVAGTHSPILNSVVPAHTHGITTGGTSASHTHSGTTASENANHTHSGTTGTMNSNTAHTHQTALYNADGGNSGARGNITFTGLYGTTESTNIDHTHNFTTGNTSASHQHTITTGGNNVDHTHSGTTDNGSSQTNWQPRYIDMLICSRN